jgi:hypothetical protein
MPGAVNGTGADTPITVTDPVVELGSPSVTIAGTVNAPAPAGAAQVNVAPLEFPEMFTNPLGSPPVQATAKPSERCTTLAALVHTIGGGTLTCTFNAPPDPLTL